MKTGCFLPVLIFLLLTSPLSVAGAGYTNVTASEAEAMIESQSSLVVLDVRTLSEYDSGHIRHAKLVPLAELEGRLSELKKSDEILVYCLSGGRSSMASQILADNGFLYVYNMLGGITAWISQGFPVYVKYTSIQDAVNTADPGRSVYVSSATYSEDVAVNKTVSIIGEAMETTRIIGDILIEASHVHFEDFTVEGDMPGSGITLSNSNSSTITGNQVRQKHWAGLTVAEHSYNNTISNNIILENQYGVTIGYLGGPPAGSDNIIADNLITNNTIGIEICTKSTGNKIVRNTLKNNSDGGIIILNSEAGSNTIYHNSMMQNGESGYGNAEDLATNIWDNGCEGNYWSDYPGTDTTQPPDGIGDTHLPWEELDQYPLVNPYWNHGDINHDLKVDIRDVATAAVAFGSFPSYPKWNPHADITGPEHLVPDSKIDIRDIALIAVEYGETY